MRSYYLRLLQEYEMSGGPQFAYLHTYEADYTAGLMAAGIELIFSTIYQIHDI